MIPHRLLILVVLGLLGYSVAQFLFPLTSVGRWNVAIDRKMAVVRAREAAAKFGSDVQGWSPTVTARYNRSIEYYLSQQADRPAFMPLTPVTVAVKFRDYRTNRSFQVDLNGGGEVIGFRQSTIQSEESSEPATGPSEDGDAGSKKDLELAERAVKQVFKESELPAALSDKGVSKEGRKFTWTVSDQALTLTGEVLVLDSAVKRVSLDATLAPQFRSRMEGRRGLFIKILSNTDQLVGWPLVILIAVFYFVGLALKQILHRLTLTFLGFSFLLCLFTGSLGNLSDGLHQETNFTGISGPYWIGPLLIWILFLLITLAIAAGLYFCAAAGLSLAIKDSERRTIDFELLFNGKLVTKPVLTSLLAGLLGGGVLSAIPYLVAVATIFLKPELNAADFEDLLVTRAPALTSFAGSGPYFIFAVFMFAGSLVGAFVKRRGLARALFFIITFLALAGTDLVYVSSTALILTALASTLLLTDLYHRYGVLAVTAAGMASEAAVNSAALCAQSSFSLQQSGWSIRIGLVVLIAAVLAGLRKAREVRPEEIAIPPGMFPTRPERERLKAEFEVARRAQQQMLPEAPPIIEGLDLAAVCQPSREVGGDLYDFITLPEGRLAIVVADVSGKGVPASLYMTLTKGLLDSVLENVSDPGEVLREVNRHLYEVCRRKVFVTLFLGIIDPAQRTLVYARAGHNPTVYCRASDRLTQLLKSPGMGLGLNNGKIFDSSLKVATLQLEPDDTLLFYSDGITEAMNGKREEYGEERLMKLAAGIDGLPAVQVCNLVMADVEKFLGSVQPQDDQTLVVVRIK